jgi:IS5 family transposase
VGIDLGRERTDGTTLLKFRRLLEDDKHKLGAALFTKVGEVLQSRHEGWHRHHRGCHHHLGAESTKNDKGERDPEMHQTKKGSSTSSA